MTGVVANPIAASQYDGSNNVQDILGKSGEQLIAKVHGDFYTPCYRGGIFTFGVAAVTLPVNAATLASVFSLYNPPGSNRNLELIDIDWCTAVATTVVNGYGIYFQGPATASKATFTTPVTPTSLLLGGNSASVATGYSALTASGTPTLACIFGGNGAVTSTYEGVNNYKFNGKIIVTPGTLIHVATTVAATTASGWSGNITWAEWPQ